MPAWLWPLAAIFVVGGGAALWWRRKSVAADGLLTRETPAEAAPPPAEQPSPPARPLPGGGARPGPALATKPVEQATRGLEVAFRPLSLYADTTQTVLEFEFTVANTSDAAIEAIRPTIAMTTAHPAVANQIATFGDSIPMSGSGDSFDLAAGGERRVVGELSLPREAMHVSDVGGRPMAVPIVLTHVRWRAGLSVKSHAEAHVVGTGDGTQKLGPLWLDRPRTQTRTLASRRL